MRIGLIGSDSSHAEDFLRLLNTEHRYPGTEITALWGDDAEMADALARPFGIVPASDPTQFLGAVDAVMIVQRHGGEHRRLALPFALAGIPAFIDKPMTCSMADAEAILDAYRASRSFVTSASALRWQPDTETLQRRMRELGGPRTITTTGIFDATSPYGGAFFYGIHAVELALQLAGADIADIEVDASQPAIVLATCRVGPIKVIVRLFHPKQGEEVDFGAEVECAQGTVAETVGLGPDYMSPVLDRFIDMLRTGKPPLSDAQLLAPVRLMSAIDQAVAENRVAHR